MRESTAVAGQRGARSRKLTSSSRLPDWPAAAEYASRHFPARVVAGNAPDEQRFAAADGLDRLLDLRPLREHDLAVERTHVVEVHVHGEPRRVEDEQVERRPTLQRDPRAQVRVAPHCVQQAEQPERLLQGLG